jgi:signal transduction histidine kinase
MTTASSSRDALRLAILLTILFAIAAVAVRVVITVIEDLPGARPETTALISFGILAITFAFMCIAGASGVWAIRFSVAREGRRRVGRFVDELAPIRDGIMTVDRQGRVIGSNPALRNLASKAIKELEPLGTVFPCLRESDPPLLLNPGETREIERICQITGAPRTLRFRSQPAEDMHVIFVSDITHHRAEEQRKEQIARFQLVGRIARGVAFDFNNLLCGIASHGGLLRRLRPGSDDFLKSAALISREAERGITLSRHLMDLSHSGMAGLPTDRIEQYSARSAELLRIALSPAWTVTLETDSAFEPVSLSGIQIEQVILNLGLLSADSLPRPGLIRVTVNKPGQDHLLNVKRSYAAILLISASAGAEAPPSPPVHDPVSHPEPESGIILSVVRTMVEECGGSLECFSLGPEQALFRVLLPRTVFPSPLEPEAEMMAFLAGLHILLAGRKETTDRVLGVIGQPNETVIHEIHDAVGLLMKAETDASLDVILIDQRLIGHEPDAFLRALMKLRPQAGIVILRDDPSVEPLHFRGVISIPPDAKAPELASAIIEAKGLAHRPR